MRTHRPARPTRCASTPMPLTPLMPLLVLLAPLAACHDDDRTGRQVQRIDVIDRSRQPEERMGAENYVLRPLTTPTDSTRIIYSPPPSLARPALADTLVRPSGATGGDVLTHPSATAPAPSAAPGRDTPRTKTTKRMTSTQRTTRQRPPR